jgi:hypothetical protein
MSPSDQTTAPAATISEIHTFGFAAWIEDLIMGHDGYTLVKPTAPDGPLFAGLRVRNAIGEEFYITIERCT